jgi:hypothetical protein
MKVSRHFLLGSVVFLFTIVPDDDEKIKAPEASILAQRKGVALEYGKH